MDTFYIDVMRLTSTPVSPDEIEKLIDEGIINEDLIVLDMDRLVEYQEDNMRPDCTHIDSVDISS
jgi:hypothetical protein